MSDLISQLPLFKGEAYRVDIPNFGIPSKATAGDIIRFEREELGNKYDVSDELLQELDRYRYDDVVWVSKALEDAEDYLSEGMTIADVTKMPLGEGARIITDDGFGGFLVLYGWAKPRPGV